LLGGDDALGNTSPDFTSGLLEVYKGKINQYAITMIVSDLEFWMFNITET
jgi:hypothetical protein